MWAQAWHIAFDAQGNPDIFITVHTTPGEITFDLKAWNGYGWDTYVTTSFNNAVKALSDALQIEQGIAF